MIIWNYTSPLNFEKSNFEVSNGQHSKRSQASKGVNLLSVLLASQNNCNGGSMDYSIATGTG